jgi:hypothetical protein
MTTEADKQVQDPDLKERLDLTKYNCNSIKIGFDVFTGKNRTHEQVIRECNLHPYCEYDTSRQRCRDIHRYPDVDAKYQEPCATLDKFKCEQNQKCYYDTKNSECKRDATKLSNEEVQKLMDDTVWNLGIKSDGGKIKRRDTYKRSKRNKRSKRSKRSKRNKRSIKHSYK